jgi:hypothetical protein
MQSTRILLSDRHFHDLRLSEMEIGVIIDALLPLACASDEDKDYRTLLSATADKLRRTLDQPVSFSLVPDDEEREWRKYFDQCMAEDEHDQPR